MEWLADNLVQAYPFADGSTDQLAKIISDALVVGFGPAPYRITAFVPGALVNAQLTIVDALGATVLSTTSATIQSLDSWVVVTAVDAARGSMCRMIGDALGLAGYPLLAQPLELVPTVCIQQLSTVTLNGLAGEVVVQFPTHVAVQATDVVTIAPVDPAERVDCASHCTNTVFAVESQAPDRSGSLAIETDGCYRLVPVPGAPHQLRLHNFCTPCIDCDNVDTLNTKFGSQAAYFHQLSAIYHDQHNRYQEAVAAANAQVEHALSTIAPFVSDCGSVELAIRAFDRPYFNQLAIAIINQSSYTLSANVAVTCSMTNVSLVSGSAVLQRFGKQGPPQSAFAGFPGNVTVGLIADETVALASELHLVDPEPALGQWQVTVAVTFTGGCGVLPAPWVVSRSLAITFPPAEPTIE